MFRRQPAVLMALHVVLVVAVGIPTIASSALAADPQPKPLKSGVVSFDDAQAHQADWGEMRRTLPAKLWGPRMY